MIPTILIAVSFLICLSSIAAMIFAIAVMIGTAASKAADDINEEDGAE